MNARGEITQDWADGTYTFRLSLAGAIELESKCNAPFATIFRRLNSDGYSISDVRETVRLGLIGGGQTPVEALNLVKRYVDDRPLVESWHIARLILAGVMFGYEEYGAKNTEAVTETEIPSSPSDSTSPPSMETQQSWDSDLTDLIDSQSGNGRPQ